LEPDPGPGDVTGGLEGWNGAFTPRSQAHIVDRKAAWLEALIERSLTKRAIRDIDRPAQAFICCMDLGDVIR
jgi:hypothetical protein